ncbi:hypothetical protein GCM10023149_42360 [Mucilaginibacter gynuensis]|uniref:Uncharacterized protein n=1 Tax=Mucilaginibacter gynuensis TaxID=1302236 RepID=A0ABP8H5S4_9SPHI
MLYKTIDLLKTHRLPLKIAALIWLCLIANLATAQNKTNALLAIKRPDNSFVTYNDITSPEEAIPQQVENKIRRILTDGKAVSQPLIFKISYNTDVALYVIKIRSAKRVCYNLVAYSTSLNQVSSTPQVIDGKWIDANESSAKTSKTPLIRFIMVNGKKAIAINESRNNGTTYNAVIDHIFELKQNMEIADIVHIESSYITSDDCTISRTLKNDEIVSEIRCKDKNPTIIGRVKLINNYQRILHKAVYQPQYAQYLITGSGIDEAVFIKQGYTTTF